MSMYNRKIKSIMVLSLFSISIIFSQLLDTRPSAYDELRDIVETASRAQQTVWVEDFTGLN